MTMMGLDDFHVHLIAQYLCSDLQQLETQVYTDAHIGRKDDADVFRSCLYAAPLLVIKTGSADDHGTPGLAADLQIRQGSLGTGKVDEHVEIVADGLQIRSED